MLLRRKEPRRMSAGWFKETVLKPAHFDEYAVGDSKARLFRDLLLHHQRELRVATIPRELLHRPLVVCQRAEGWSDWPERPFW